MSVRSVDGRYVVEFQQGGKRVFRRCPPGITKAQAQEFERKIRSDLFDAERLGRKPEPSLVAAVQTYLDASKRLKTHERITRNAVDLAPYIAGKMLSQAPEVGRTFMAARKELAPASVNLYLCVLKAACRHAFETELVDQNHSPRIKLLSVNNEREVYLSRSEIAQLVKAAETPAIAAVITLAAYTGLRRGELLGLKKADIDGGVIRLSRTRTKTGKPRLVPVPKIALGALKAVPFGLTVNEMDYLFRKARKAAKLVGVHFHDLRHSTASLLINEGVPLYIVSAILGHSSVRMSQRYAHLELDALKRAMRKLG